MNILNGIYISGIHLLETSLNNATILLAREQNCDFSWHMIFNKLLHYYNQKWCSCIPNYFICHVFKIFFLENVFEITNQVLKMHNMYLLPRKIKGIYNYNFKFRNCWNFFNFFFVWQWMAVMFSGFFCFDKTKGALSLVTSETRFCCISMI